MRLHEETHGPHSRGSYGEGINKAFFKNEFKLLYVFFQPLGPNSTTCSGETFLLGPGQRVVSFTYYEGDTYDTVYKRDYFAGVKANADAVAKHLPKDFRMR